MAKIAFILLSHKDPEGIIDQARRKRPALFSEISNGEGQGVVELADEATASPEAVTDLRLLEDRLHEALKSLSPAHRVAFESAVLQQQTYREIASEQGWSLEQVKTNVYRGRKKVMSRLRDYLQPNMEYRP